MDLLDAEKDAISQWTGSEPALSEPENTVAVFDAQSWATRARAYDRWLRAVLGAVQETMADLERRTAQQVGVNPTELAEHVAGQIEEVATLLEQLSHGGQS